MINTLQLLKIPIYIEFNPEKSVEYFLTAFVALIVYILCRFWDNETDSCLAEILRKIAFVIFLSGLISGLVSLI